MSQSAGNPPPPPGPSPFRRESQIVPPRPEDADADDLSPLPETVFPHLLELEAEADCYRGRSLAVMTSGGDSQGMNAAVRAVVRFGIHLGCKVYFIYEGYQGLVDGDIEEATWTDVSGILNRGGTVIGTARCKEFRTRQGKLKAARNMIRFGIDNLVVIGGDGSLTGADIFRQEWPSLLDELVSAGSIDKGLREKCQHLSIVGIVGSIDNDFCGTDMTIGADTALHRIIESADAILPTAGSHQRTFILEVMGRHCGYIALMAATVCEADFVFIPEWPPESDWPQVMCKKLRRTRELGQRLNIIIVAEGAVDRLGKPITPEDVKEVVQKNLKQDTRITILGHVQRGGAPSSFDRILGCRMGADAVCTVMKARPEDEPRVVSITGNLVGSLPLRTCVERTLKVKQAMDDMDWSRACQLRGTAFMRNLQTYRMLNKYQPHSLEPTAEQKADPHNLAIMNVGAPCGGMNAAVNSFVRNTLITGNVAFGIQNGVDGLLEGKLERMSWSSVTGLVLKGGSHLGTKRLRPTGREAEVAEQLRKHNIHGLVVVGGFEAYQVVQDLYEKRADYPEFRIPMIVVPATISNNVPGTEFSLGCDTALNEITQICDKLRQSAQGSKSRVFVVETHGGYCGFLATMAGLASGADAAYIYEEPFNIKTLTADLEVIKSRFQNSQVQRGLILRNERASKEYTTEFIKQLYAAEGGSTFSARANVLGHIQQGGSPSVFDRSLGIKLAVEAHKWLLKTLERDGPLNSSGEDTACLIGIVRSQYRVQSLEQLREETDYEHRVWKSTWWMKQRRILKVLAAHDTVYKKD